MAPKQTLLVADNVINTYNYPIYCPPYINLPQFSRVKFGLGTRLVCYWNTLRVLIFTYRTLSTVLPVVSGVPHAGFRTWPTVFLIYINEVTCVVSNGKMVVYADDIALYQIIQSPEDYLVVQHDINAVSEWITANYLALNYQKCCHLLFSRKRSPTLPVASLEITGNIVNQVREYKYLGVILSSDMSWSSHTSAISSKTRKLIGVLYRKFYFH